MTGTMTLFYRVTAGSKYTDKEIKDLKSFFIYGSGQPGYKNKLAANDVNFKDADCYALLREYL